MQLDKEGDSFINCLPLVLYNRFIFMENLNSEQKIFIKTFVDSWMKNKITLTIGQIESTDFQIDKKNDKYYLLTNTKDTEPVAVLFDVIYILRSLEENNFLYFSKIKGTIPLYEHQKKKYALEIIDENLIEYLDKNFDKSIVITQALINFVNQDFKTPEQQKYYEELSATKKTLKYNQIALIISLIGLLVSTGFNIYNTLQTQTSIIKIELPTQEKKNRFNFDKLRSKKYEDDMIKEILDSVFSGYPDRNNLNN